MDHSPDRLYDLLPVVYRQRDAEEGYSLQALLQVMAEQVDLVEANIAQLYENWFIETCEDWIVPYLGDLIGYQPVYEAGKPGDVTDDQAQQRTKILIPRREVANTIRYRRRKGTLALLELLANDVAGWPARAVSFFTLLGWTQSMQHLRPAQGRTVDMRQGVKLADLSTPFDELAHTVDVRQINSRYQPGWYNLPNVGLFVWRLKSYSITQAPAYCLDRASQYYTFSILGNDAPLFARPTPETEPTDIAQAINLPVRIRRKVFEIEENKRAWYGPDKSLQIWTGVLCPDDPEEKKICQQPVPVDKIVVADLSDWDRYSPGPGQIAVDPELGRIIFSSKEQTDKGVWVSYHYGFSVDMGGGEYGRTLRQPALRTNETLKIYRVGEGEDFDTIRAALEAWAADHKQERVDHAIIEISDNRDYTEKINITLAENQTLQLRAAKGVRPVIRLLNYRTNRRDDLSVEGKEGSRFALDGLLVMGRPVEIQGPLQQVTIRHCTLVPGWSIDHLCEPEDPEETSLELTGTPGTHVTIEHSILGTIQVNQNEVDVDPIAIHLSDTILDATDPTLEAVGGPGGRLAHAVLTIERCTVFGQIQTHAIDLAENSIFDGRIRVGRRKRGCIRFCYVTPDSRTPRRYRCQPDLVEEAVKAEYPRPGTERDKALARERLRVKPQFNSTRYGTPTYAQLAETCAEEIKQGAEDESEMGVFHDLYNPQRAANLRARLEEFTPAGVNVGIILVT